ncbi:peptidylprolyl isomerase [Sinomonas mesophila]|uniref:peptidylprolyl isomerase n=1 Tax=Sinomonas mesophila TaxID=1531955 RepID=UPI000986C7C4|nr:peptidylprolyl isomerase [Sinomonas mesophila]
MEAKAALRRDQLERRRRDNLIASAVTVGAIVLAAVLQSTVFASNPTAAEYAAAQAGLETPSPSPSPSVPNAPHIPAPDTAAGRTFTGQLVLNGQPLGIELDGNAAPQAAAVFKSLADAGTLTGRPCHRLTTATSFGVLQCGALDLTGTPESDYSWGPVENAPADGVYPAGTIAVARKGNDAYSNGQQFFIVYRDTTIPSDSAGGYSVVGRVTSGLEAVQQFAAAGTSAGEDGPPVTPVTIDSLTVN